MLFTLSIVFTTLACENSEDTSAETSTIEDVGTLLTNSDDFTNFASLIATADLEVPSGEMSIRDLLSEISPNFEITVFAPSNAVFETLALQWSSPDFQASVEDVIAEFTHNGQPAKTRDFVLGHIFKSDKRINAATFSTQLLLRSEKGTRWQIIPAPNATSGFGIVLEGRTNSNPYFIYETDVLIGSNGVVHAALVN